MTAQVVEYGNLVWFRISANTKTTLNKGTEYKPFSISSSAPLFSVYRRITIDELKSFNFKIDQSGQVTIIPNVQIPEGTGINVSELYLKKIKECYITSYTVMRVHWVSLKCNS
mgnify:CR=1 FL=1